MAQVIYMEGTWGIFSISDAIYSKEQKYNWRVAS